MLAARGAIIDLGVEYLIDNQRPSKSAPFNSIEASAEAVPLNSTMAVPDLRPSSCKGNSIVVGPLPHDLKKSRTCSLLALHGKSLMYNLGGGPLLSAESFCFFMGGSGVCSSSSFASFCFFDAFSSSSESKSESLSNDEMGNDDGDNQEFEVEVEEEFVVETVVQEDEVDNRLTIYRNQPLIHPPPYEVDNCLTIYQSQPNIHPPPLSNNNVNVMENSKHMSLNSKS